MLAVDPADLSYHSARITVCYNIGRNVPCDNASGTYYAKWILGNDNIVGIMGAVGLIPTFVGFAVVGPMAKKFGVRKTLLIGFAVGIIGADSSRTT